MLKTRQGDAKIPHFEGGNKALYMSLEHFRQCIVNGHKSRTGPERAIRIIQILQEADQQLSMDRLRD